MKTPLSFCLAAAVVSTFACSDEGGTDRDNTTGGSGGQTGGVAGSSAQGGSSGSPSTSGGAGGGTGGPNTGAALVIGELDEGGNVPITDSAGMTGINGAAYIVASRLANMGAFTTPATLTAPAGKVCAAGQAPAVPGAMGAENYTEYWGAEIDFDLNRVAADMVAAQVLGDAGVDAGGDAGGAAPLGSTAGPWTPGNVIGFSFTIDGPTMPTQFRFKSRPVGAETSENFCFTVPQPIVSGTTYNVPFTDIRRDCWNMPGETASLFQDPKNYTQLQNVGWQVSAMPVLPIPFDFCVSNIKPMLRPAP
jgi:hypothetical protein